VQAIWSNTDFVYMCLRDRRRTEAFRAAITAVVRPGDHVLEIGAGSGILSLFACEAGAATVTAVEVDPVLADLIAATARANGLHHRMTVINADARESHLPPADVVIAELIETGLLDEPQIPVINSLIQRGTITTTTRVIPAGYRTELRLVTVDERMYGHTIKALRHEWPFYSRDENWTTVAARNVSDRVTVWQGQFNDGPHSTTVQRRLRFTVPNRSMVNGLRICGTAVLTAATELGACDTVNGDKIIPLPPRTVAGPVELDVAYEMGGGLASVTTRWCATVADRKPPLASSFWRRSCASP
jgi:predicted RNA methylase